MVSRINAFCLAALLLTACGSSEDADGAPGYETGTGAASQAGSAGSAGASSSAGAAGSAGTAQLASGGTGGAPQVEGDACDFGGPYRLVSVLTAGGSECAAGVDVAATLAGRDEDACTATFCVEGQGQNCIRGMVCELGNPVEECVVSITNDGCTHQWTMVRGG
jgi:hypothetical protein